VNEQQRATTSALITQVCGSDAVLAEPDLDLLEAGLLDSLALVELLVGLDEEFGLEISPTEVEREEVSSVNKIMAFVEAGLSRS
jgi:D-alanine--poly(phosphoribitol) ligase subunit 2